jgi:hypothetical protein
MKTKEYEFIKRHFVVLDSATENGRSAQKITRFLLCSAMITLFSSHFRAQAKNSESVSERPYSASSVISLYGKERNDLSDYVQRKSANTRPIELQSKEIKEVLSEQDYFPADLFLNEGNKTNVQAPSGHNTKVNHYDSQNVVFDGKTHENLTVYEIFDQYILKNKNTESDYHYDNTYYLFRDTAGNTIATVYYIDRTIGFLKSEYKVISKGKSLATFPLLVAPNPARHIINITYQVEQEGQASLQIIDMNGRTADIVFSEKQIKSGRYTVQHNINLPAGNYLIQFNVQGQAPVTQKIIVQ